MKKIAYLTLVLALALALLAPSLAFADADDTITVTGSAVVKATPDSVLMYLGVTQFADSVLTAQSSANAKIADIKAALIEAGVAKADVETSSYNIYTQYDYSTGTETIIGYNANVTLAVTVRDVDNAGAAIDAAFTAGANQFNTFQFRISDSSVYYDQALALAVESAKHKAQVLAGASGVTLGSVTTVVENGEYYYDPANNGTWRMAEADSASGATDLGTSLVNVTASVTLTFDIKG